MHLPSARRRPALTAAAVTASRADRGEKKGAIKLPFFVLFCSFPEAESLKPERSVLRHPRVHAIRPRQYSAGEIVHLLES